MASYNADINVNVKVLDQQLRDLEQRLNKLKNVNPFLPSGAARTAKQEIQEEVQRINAIRDRRDEELKLLRLENAKQLQQTRLVALERANAFSTKARAKAIEKLNQIQKAFPDDPRIQERVATGLGRILSTQKEINRATTSGVQQRQRIADYDKEIQTLRKVGATEGELRKAQKRRFEFIDAAYKKQDDLANRREVQLKREIKNVQDKYRLELKAFNTAAKAESSPLSRAPKRTVLDTPEAAAKKAAYYEGIGESLLRQVEKTTQAEIKGATKVNTLKKKQEKTLFDLESKYQDDLVKQKIKDQDRIAKIELKDAARRNRVALREFDKKLRDAESQRRSRQAASPIRGTETMVGSPKYLEARQKRQEKVKNSWLKALNQISQYETKINSRRVAEDKATIKRDNQIKNNWIKALNQMESIEAGFERKRNTRSRQKSSRRNRRISNIATGFGFPLLFGGGPGQAIAGGLGGALGGFGGSIAATAIFSQLEKFGGAAIKTGTALRSTSGALELVRENSLFTEQATSDYADELERLGEVEKLSTLLTKELVDKIGNNGVIALQNLGAESDKTTRLWGELTVQLQRLIAGPLTGFLNIVNQALSAVTGAQRREAFFADLGPREAEARARFQQLTGQARFGTGRSAEKLKAAAEARGEVFLTQEEALAELRKEFTPEVTATIPITAADRKSIKGKTAKDDTEQAFKLLLALQRRQLVLTKVTDLEKTLFEIRNKEIDTEARITKFRGITDELREQLRIENERASAAERLDAVLSDALSKTATAYQALKPIDDEIRLLEATLAGKKEEFLVEQQIQQIRQAAPGLTREEVAAKVEKLNSLREEVKLAERLEQIYSEIGQKISTGIVDALTSAVDGTKSLADVASNLLKDIGRLLLQLGINTALSATGLPIFGGLRGFANGGRPPVNKPSIVGERGPELFVPRSSGTIIPNDKMMGGSSNVVVNVDATGSKVEGDNNQASQLGKVIGAAVQAELVKQKRPGGLLAGV